MLHNGLVYLSVVGIEEMKIVKRNDFDAPASVSAGHIAAIEDIHCYQKYFPFKNWLFGFV